jgi:hypothetical protein
MKLDPGMHIGMHLVSFGKPGVTPSKINSCFLLFAKTVVMADDAGREILLIELAS